jgi:hypothetical protein
VRSAADAQLSDEVAPATESRDCRGLPGDGESSGGGVGGGAPDPTPAGIWRSSVRSAADAQLSDEVAPATESRDCRGLPGDGESSGGGVGGGAPDPTPAGIWRSSVRSAADAQLSDEVAPATESRDCRGLPGDGESSGGGVGGGAPDPTPAGIGRSSVRSAADTIVSTLDRDTRPPSAGCSEDSGGRRCGATCVSRTGTPPEPPRTQRPGTGAPSSATPRDRSPLERDQAAPAPREFGVCPTAGSGDQRRGASGVAFEAAPVGRRCVGRGSGRRAEAPGEGSTAGVPGQASHGHGRIARERDDGIAPSTVSGGQPGRCSEDAGGRRCGLPAFRTGHGCD